MAFTASVSHSSSSWSTSTLVFPVVITNLGNGYNPNDGVFTSPTAGMYVFFVNVQSYNSLSVYVDIVVNGARKVRTMASNHYDACPNLAVLTLLKQVRVWVKLYSGQGYYSNGPMTTFCGFLIGWLEKIRVSWKIMHWILIKKFLSKTPCLLYIFPVPFIHVVGLSLCNCFAWNSNFSTDCFIDYEYIPYIIQGSK